MTLKTWRLLKKTLMIDIPKRDIDPNNDEFALLDDTSKKTRSKHRFKIPKSHPISNIIGHVNE